MTRQTIDVGIDLGTTNSEIALRKGPDAQIIPNNENAEFTPSAVWIDKKGAINVGHRAKAAETRESETNDVSLQFKRRMGEAKPIQFVRAKRSLRPEELSAEVLKVLLGDLRQRGEDTEAAVITVPAAFELPQCEATKRAAQLAGLRQSPLVQEPVAAAMAYGFQSESDRATWLVFDFGGGTFDAALVSVKDGFIQVLNHGGDNLLGGGDIDRELTKRLVIPFIKEHYQLAGFAFGSSKWKWQLAKLKYEVEQAKILLSRETNLRIEIGGLCLDDRGQMVEIDLEITQDQVAAIAEPFILRAAKIAKQVLAEKRVGVGSIDKVIMVGGPTLAPYFREILSDPAMGLGIPLDYSVNPITVVAKGAALFAGTQQLERGSSQARAFREAADAGKYFVEFVDYKSTGPDVEPPIGGRVISPKGLNLHGFAIEFSNPSARPPWNSGRVPLEESGVFMSQLFAKKGRENVFAIMLYDPQGRSVAVEPSEISFTPGIVNTDVPLIHDIRYETHDGGTRMIVPKGTALPIPTIRFEVTQVNLVKKGTKDNWIKIPIVEGGSDRANRNTPIGCFEKSGEDLTRDLPAGSKVEVSLDIDASRIVTVQVYIPLLDQDFEAFQARFNPDGFREEDLDPNVLEEELRAAEHRLDQLRDKAAKTADPEAWSALEKIEADEMVEHAESALEEAETDRSMAEQGMKHLKELCIALDGIEDQLAWPALVAESTEAYQYAEDAVSTSGTAEQRQSLALLRRELDAAIAARDTHTLKQKVEQFHHLGYTILSQRIEWWEGWYDYLKKQKHQMTDQAAASQWTRQGDRALYAKDLESLSKACLQLRTLLPVEEQERAERFRSTIQ